MKCQILFSGKNNKIIIINLPSAEFTQRKVIFKGTMLFCVCVCVCVGGGGVGVFCSYPAGDKCLWCVCACVCTYFSTKNIMLLCIGTA